MMIAFSNSQLNLNLEDALKHCRQTAQRGYEIANENLREIENAIIQTNDSIAKHIRSLEDTPIHTIEIKSELQKQLLDYTKYLQDLQQICNQKLNAHRQRLDRFSITLFGRTMSGKSTLMEILTNGDGRSIGTGRQRTTRDVRVYEWKGLEITDVPGIAAFEGEEDEEVAFKAASQADLILFLITDDAPQPVEAKRLAKIRELGKPVLGICNVKHAVDNKDELELFFRDLERYFNDLRINELLAQFHALSDRYMPESRIPFMVTHLLSRYLANRADYETYRERLIEVSRFHQVEARIIKEVAWRGAFLRFKNFVDLPAAFISQLSDELLKSIESNHAQKLVYEQILKRFSDWLQEFKERANKRAHATIANEVSKLCSAIPQFAEENFNNGDAEKEWENLERDWFEGVKRSLEELGESLIEECNRALVKFSDKLRAELFMLDGLHGSSPIYAERVSHLKENFDFGAKLFSGGLFIESILLHLSPLWWAGIGVTILSEIISSFLDDYEEKAEEAKKKVRKQLRKRANDIKSEIWKNFQNWFEEQIQQQLETLHADLEQVIKTISTLVNEQRSLAHFLNYQQKKLARLLIEEALDHFRARALTMQITDVARVPGFATMLMLQPEVIFPDLARQDLLKLFDESIYFVENKRSKLTILCQAIGQNCDEFVLSNDEINGIVYASLDELDNVTKMRVKLAEQLTGLHVMKPTDRKDYVK